MPDDIRLSDANGDGLTIVGIGASAGGLGALKSLFEAMPQNPDVAFVVVVHLSPEHESHLPSLLQSHCPMPVQQVMETTALERNCVYVIPPNANLTAIDTHLRLTKLEARRAERAPIDHFFRTLAESHDGHSVGVILSGTGSDGTLGMRRIKEAGGLTIAQDPEEAEHDGMPRSAIGTGMVDAVLPIDEMPGEILSFARTKLKIAVPEDGEELDGDNARILQKIFAQVRARTGHDFGLYKRSTVMRRILRRMQLHSVQSLGEYLELLRIRRDETIDLYDDLLITVTEFFRDKEVFAYLKNRIIPRLLETKRTADDRVRVWSVGCSTGEEAYSLAMLVLEATANRESRPQIQVFASDLHESVLTRARDGVYPEEIAEDVSPERLERFFVHESGHYRVRREVREMIVFAPHNLLSDPPFSHIDLIVCRNVLIYLRRDVQRDVVGLFHYALEPDGVLVLGTSETIDRTDLFASEDKDARVYRKRKVPVRPPALPLFPLGAARSKLEMGAQREVHARDRHTFGAIHEKSVERFAPPSVLINSEHDIVHTSASAGRFLQVPGGEQTNNAFRLIREPLQIELRAALHAARQTRSPVRSRAVRVKIDGQPTNVSLRVQTATDPDLEGFYLVIFEEYAAEAESAGSPEPDASIKEMELELDLGRQRLQGLIEEYEAGREEMQASNEELQSTNEELRSTMEELETSKEELQSMNEELATLNQENRHRMEELSQLSTDQQNLLAATKVATLFLDRELRIMRFTPTVGDLFNIRRTDQGRPLTDLTHKLGDLDLQADALDVLDKLQAKEREVRGANGGWYLARIVPYRGMKDRIEGVVITLVDITERKKFEEELRDGDERKTQFLGLLSHELRNPLAVIRNTMELLDHNGGDAEARQSYGTIREQLDHMVALVDDLLDVTRISRGIMRLREEPIDLNELLGTVGEHARPRMEAAQLNLKVSRAQQPLFVLGDRVRIAQIFNNFLDNACKFTPPGGEIRITAHPEDGQAVLTVSDTGVGIPPDKLNSIFDIFVQVDTSPERAPQGGLGIGLTIVKRLVELHGGQVSVRSEGPGRGSEFEVRLPLTGKAARPPRDVTASAVPRTKSSLAPKPSRVLVVDDNYDSAQSLMLLMQKLGGHEVQVAHTGSAALDVAAKFKPEIVLLDIGLPGMNGYEVCRRMRATDWGKTALILAVTGWGQEKDRGDAQSAGFDAHVIKPVVFENLSSLLGSLQAERAAG